MPLVRSHHVGMLVVSRLRRLLLLVLVLCLTLLDPDSVAWGWLERIGMKGIELGWMDGGGWESGCVFSGIVERM